MPQGSWDLAWQAAVELSAEALRAADVQERALKTGARYDEESRAAELEFLGRPCRVSWTDFEVTATDTGQPIPTRERILLLHYLETASGALPTGAWIGFNEVAGAELYLGNYRARSVERLLREFAGKEDALVEAGSAMGGHRTDHGDVAIELLPLPRVPVSVVLWRGDEEFPPAGEVLLDATVSQYLAIEDMVVLAEMVAGRLCEAHRNGSDRSRS